MEPVSDLLFVYGTLRRGAYRGLKPNPFALRLESEAEWLGPARIHGRLYQVNPEYPGLAPAVEPHETVAGEVWQFSDPDLWRALDAYEGEEYQRVRWPITFPDGSHREGWVYLYASKITTAMAIVAV